MDMLALHSPCTLLGKVVHLVCPPGKTPTESMSLANFGLKRFSRYARTSQVLQKWGMLQRRCFASQVKYRVLALDGGVWLLSEQ